MRLRFRVRALRREFKPILRTYAGEQARYRHTRGMARNLLRLWPALLGTAAVNYGRRSVLAADDLAPVCAHRVDVALGGPDFTIVVGFDGSPRAEDALALGGLLAVRAGARLVVVCV